jgi:hypothetical protein
MLKHKNYIHSLKCQVKTRKDKLRGHQEITTRVVADRKLGFAKRATELKCK